MKSIKAPLYGLAMVVMLLGAPAFARAQSPTATNMSPEQFTKQTAITNMAEVQLGLMAETKASSPQVKAFAQRMVRDHEAMQSSLQDAARLAGTTMPDTIDPKQMALKNELAAKSGSSFDKAYIDAMVKGHRQAMQMLQGASQDLSNNALKKVAASALPIVQSHLKEAEQIAQRLRSGP
jgi:putative membrane protein